MSTNTANQQILIIDDEPDLIDLLEFTIIKMGLTPVSANNVKDAIHHLQQQSFALILTDMKLPDGLGLEIVEYVAKHVSNTPIAVITAYGNTDNAIAALKAGAFDYVNKPVELAALRELIKNALKLPVPPSQQSALKKDGSTPPHDSPLHKLIGIAPIMQEIRQSIQKLARSLAPVLVTGESGSGKEMASQLIHQMGPRHDEPFIAVNCGAIPENLMESEFFGYKKGAFTGADQEKDGFFQAANGGTLFLDEVAELPLAMQVKLLRVIQERKVRKVGASTETSIDVRIISATHRDLTQWVEQGKFRQDLYYRLNVITLRMPSLRERREDILPLTQTLLLKLAKRNGWQHSPALTPHAEQALLDYTFPGNVRELENTLERALAFCDGSQIDAPHLGIDAQNDAPLDIPPIATTLEIRPQHATLHSNPNASTLEHITLPINLETHLDTIEQQLIEAALIAANYNRTAAAKLLGLNFRQLRYRLQRLDIKFDDNDNDTPLKN
jgi:two-component system, NtrC family, response regulator PilR